MTGHKPHHPSPHQLDRELAQSVRTLRLDLVRHYLKHGASARYHGEDGGSLIHMLVTATEVHSGAWREILAVLLDRGVDINSRDFSSMTPLHHACHHKRMEDEREKIQDLIFFGADLDAKDDLGMTPLHYYALSGKNHAVLKLLVDEGADINARDMSGRTPLHVAVERGDFGVIRQLILLGADVELRTVAGKNARNIAVDHNMIFLAKFFDRMEKEAQRAKLHQQNAWKVLGEEKIARTQTEPAIGYRFTEVFNFAARSYTQIASNLETGAESMVMKSFDEMHDHHIIELAHAQLVLLGGTVEVHSVRGRVSKPRGGSL